MDIHKNCDEQINKPIEDTTQPSNNESSGCGKLSATYCIKINLEDEGS